MSRSGSGDGRRIEHGYVLGLAQGGTRGFWAGFAKGPDAEACFLANLTYDCARALDLKMLIEPLNRHDAPGYFLATTTHARTIIDAVGAPNLKLMFDCYHVGRTEGDLLTRLKDLGDPVGHIQFASVPDRGTPDHGEINYPSLFEQIDNLGWDSPLGAEYKPGQVVGCWGPLRSRPEPVRLSRRFANRELWPGFDIR